MDKLLLLFALDEIDSDMQDLMLLTAVALCKERKHNRMKQLSSFSGDEIAHMCRFITADLRRLRQLLLIPDTLKAGKEGYRIHGDDALMVTLRRLTYPCHTRDLAVTFGMSKIKVSVVFNTVVNHIYILFFFHLFIKYK